jgi:hypothetical protein
VCDGGNIVEVGEKAGFGVSVDVGDGGSIVSVGSGVNVGGSGV